MQNYINLQKKNYKYKWFKKTANYTYKWLKKGEKICRIIFVNLTTSIQKNDTNNDTREKRRVKTILFTAYILVCIVKMI